VSLGAAAERMQEVGLEDASLTKLLDGMRRVDDLRSENSATSRATPTQEVRSLQQHHEAFARRRLLHEAAGFPDEPPFHVGFDLMTTLESDECGGTDHDPTDTLLRRALEQIHITQELTDRQLRSSRSRTRARRGYGKRTTKTAASSMI
jgi:hypothetical protein